MRNWLLAITLLPTIVTAEYCRQWEYSNLSFNQTLVYKDNSVVGSQNYIIWNEDKAVGVWQGNTPITGSIKSTLKDYFNVKIIDITSILNSIGRRGWEGFSHQRTRISEKETNDYWDFKRCLITKK